MLCCVGFVVVLVGWLSDGCVLADRSDGGARNDSLMIIFVSSSIYDLVDFLTAVCCGSLTTAGALFC